MLFLQKAIYFFGLLGSQLTVQPYHYWLQKNRVQPHKFNIRVTLIVQNVTGLVSHNKKTYCMVHNKSVELLSKLKESLL